MAESEAVTLFREYLRIKTVHPTPDYAGAVQFFKKMADRHGLAFHTTEMVSGKPIITLTWQGKDPSLRAILLNSHIDVVPVVAESWTHDPWAAEKDASGNIFARGAQDMKCVSIQHIEAIGTLKRHGLTPDRTVIVSLVPDEEIGGADGMAKWSRTEGFRKLNIGFALDEGLANPTKSCSVYYGERVAWWLHAETVGPAGHGSQLLPATATTKLMKFLAHFSQLRDEELTKLEEDGVQLGEVTTANINMIKTGMFSSDGEKWQANIIPPKAAASIDIRVTPSRDLTKFDSQIAAWAKECDVKVSWLNLHDMENPTTSTDPSKNIWWKTFSHVVEDLGIPIAPLIFPAATDSRFLRQLGIPAIGFSPMTETTILLHDHDEYLNETTFLKGIAVFEVLVNKLAHIPRQSFD